MVDMKLEVVIIPVSDADRAAHGEHEKRTGQAAEQTGTELPT